MVESGVIKIECPREKLGTGIGRIVFNGKNLIKDGQTVSISLVMKVGEIPKLEIQEIPFQV